MKRLLVIRLSALGDAAMMLPVVKQRSSANPDTIFVVTAPPLVKPLFDGLPNVEFHGIRKKQSAWKLFKAFNALNCQEVADLHHVNRIDRALILLRLRNLFNRNFKVIHINKDRTARRNYINKTHTSALCPQWQKYDDVFNRLGLNGKTEEIPIVQRHHKEVSHTYIGFAPFAQHKGKTWPKEYSKRLIQMLSENGYSVFLFGGNDDAPTFSEWTFGLSNVKSLAGCVSFSDELLNIKQLDLMISMDSANMHFASAVGTPVLSIWGATHPTMGFYGFGQNSDHAISSNIACQPCSAFGSKPCKRGDYACLEAITPEIVMNKIQATLG